MRGARPGSDPTDLRLLRHRDGASALLVASLAAAAGVGVLAPWYEVRAVVTLLDRAASTPLGTLAGWQAHAWAVVVVVVAAAGAAAGAMVAVDRPPEDGRRRVLAVGGVLALLGLAGVVVRPDASRFRVAPGALADLGAVDGTLPEGVRATMAVAPEPAVWLVVVAGVALLALAWLHPSLRT